jgi:hypothetical protein
MSLVRYVHLNPLRAGLVADLDALAAYEWSGHGALVGRRRPLPFESVADSLALFDSDATRAIDRLIDWMAAAPAAAPAPSGPTDAHARGDLGRLIDAICHETGVAKQALLGGSRAGNVSRARALICHAAGELGLPGRTIARMLGISPGAVSQSRLRGETLARQRRAAAKLNS